MKKLNLNKTLLVIIIALTVQGVKAQSNFLKGYLLLSESDSLFGFIDNKNYINNSQFCDFKGTDTDSIVRYYPNQIFGYRFIDGKYYVSKTLEVDNKKVQIFLEYLIHGKLDIYFYKDKQNENLYFVSKDTLPLTELKYSKELVNENGKTFLKESKNYVTPLIYLTNDCEEIKNEIPKIDEPNHNKLINFAEKYHNLTCDGEECIIYEKRLPQKVKFNIMGGITKFTREYNKDVPYYGFNFLFQQSQINERFFLGIGLYEADIENAFIMRNLQVPLSINYIHPRKGFSPILSYEIDLNHALNIQYLNIGANYNFKKVSFALKANLATTTIVVPIGYSINFGISFDLN